MPRGFTSNEVHRKTLVELNSALGRIATLTEQHNNLIAKFDELNEQFNGVSRENSSRAAHEVETLGRLERAQVEASHLRQQWTELTEQVKQREAAYEEKIEKLTADHEEELDELRDRINHVQSRVATVRVLAAQATRARDEARVYAAAMRQQAFPAPPEFPWEAGFLNVSELSSRDEPE